MKSGNSNIDGRFFSGSCVAMRARGRATGIVLAGVFGVSMLCGIGACSEKKRNANHDMQKKQTSLMDQMDKIAAEEEASRAAAEAKAAESGDGTKTPTGTDDPKSVEPSKGEPPETPRSPDQPPV
ncbi:MAG: hypothetical protein H7210_07250 [Pyrinomonadaceae bacterium]|nr:hypothetical protein [Phycisphaerales bacterium]